MLSQPKKSNIEGIGVFAEQLIEKDAVFTTCIGKVATKEEINEHTVQIHNEFVNGAESKSKALLQDFFMGAHFLNDKIHNLLKRKHGDNNVCFEGLLLKAKTLIRPGVELCVAHNYTSELLENTKKR